MPGVLLDTHVLIWMVASKPLSAATWETILAAQNAKNLFVTPMTAWEAGLADLKPLPRRPDLLGLPPDEWFLHALESTEAEVLAITKEIAMEACLVPAVYGSGDPGDCFLIATARVHDLTLITRDERIHMLARQQPHYLHTLAA
jgi:PIN domain nuclease of toxin-antitoxin system